MKVKSESEVTQSCPTLSDPMDCLSSINYASGRSIVYTYNGRSTTTTTDGVAVKIGRAHV